MCAIEKRYRPRAPPSKPDLLRHVPEKLDTLPYLLDVQSPGRSARIEGASYRRLCSSVTCMNMCIDRIRLPPLNAVRAFESAARHRSFRVAADELFVSAGAVGQHIRALESKLGVKLFVRQAGLLVPTEAALAYARAVREGLQQISKATAELTTGQRTFTIWAPPTLAARWLVHRLDAFQAGRVDIDLRICANIAQADLHHVDVDVVIEHARHPSHEGSLMLFEEEVFPVCSPSLHRQLPRLPAPGVLLKHRLLHTSLHDLWERWLAEAGVVTDGLRRGPFFNQATLALEAASLGQGFALSIDQLVDRDLRDGRLVRAFPMRLRTGMAYWLGAPQGTLKAGDLVSIRALLLDA